jgi:hypothetical protein
MLAPELDLIFLSSAVEAPYLHGGSRPLQDSCGLQVVSLSLSLSDIFLPLLQVVPAVVLVVAGAAASLLEYFYFSVMFSVHQFWRTTIFFMHFEIVCRAATHGKGFSPCMAINVARQRSFAGQFAVMRPLTCVSLENAQQKLCHAFSFLCHAPNSLFPVVQCSKCAF